MLDCQLFGLAAGKHHLVNLLLHSLNALLVFRFLLLLTDRLWRSAFVAALFALHPLHIQSVVWISERKDVLSTALGLLSLICYVRYARSTTSTDSTNTARSSRRALHFIAAFLLLALGLLSKPMLVTWPFLMLLIDFWPLGRLPLDSTKSFLKKLLRLTAEKIPFLILSTASCIVTFIVQQKARAVLTLGEMPLGYRLDNCIVAYARYILKAFYPVDLSFFYPHPGTWPTWVHAASITLLAFTTFLAIWLAKSRGYLLTGWFWFLGTLVPVIGLIQVGLQSIADRYTYIPYIGLFVCIVWAVADVAQRFSLPRTALWLASSAVLVASGVITRQQMQYWESSISLTRHALTVTQYNHMAHYCLGLALADAGKSDEAIVQFRETVRLQPAFAEACHALCNVLQKERRNLEAIDQLKITLSWLPDDAVLHERLGTLLAGEGRITEAIPHFIDASRYKPSAQAHYNLALAFVLNNEHQSAIFHYRQALKMRPAWPAALNDLAWILATHPDSALRNGHEAVVLAQQACQLSEGKEARYLGTLDAAYAESGRFAEAIATAQKARDLARTNSQSDVVEAANNRLKLYASDQPYRQPLPTAASAGR